MPLAGVLSALREIILDDLYLPHNQHDRFLMFRDRFPALDQEEVEDLAKMDPKKLEIYTNSIFVGEKNLLAQNFPLTIKILEENWHLVSTEKFSLFKLAKDLHKKFPWKTTDMPSLGKNFLNYIEVELAQIHCAVSYLKQIAEMELSTREVKKAPNGPFTARSSLKHNEISTLSVAELLELKYFIPECNKFCRFDYDLIKYRGSFLANRSVLPEPPQAKLLLASCSRPCDTLPRWTELESPLFDFLLKQDKGEFLPLENLAEVYITSSVGDKSEQELFILFVQDLMNLLNNGILVIPGRNSTAVISQLHS